ncbi:Rieske 2Fe-2S domain-containing protein [Actinomadura fibrosa]|uniref:Rieske-type oxygenase n=1 Tax=Actinomadura fibrosa TaxID=111802 RepID=A0ABW2XCG2_9ACTN|nr:Rieske 2Fe-2S domain-containing protein [Actinomadura fibrosa]
MTPHFGTDMTPHCAADETSPSEMDATPHSGKNAALRSGTGAVPRRDSARRVLPPARPDGWYGVAFGAELRPGQVLRRRLMGEDVVLYRTRGGTPRAVRPYCPHLGAHLGHGGTVEGEELVCPFHRFAFAADGTCVRTGNGAPPPRTRLSLLEVRESDGALLVWWDASGGPPRWEVPSVMRDGFPAPIRRFHRLTAHPQDIVENTVDMGHFTALHGYRSARVENLEFDGPRMRADVVTRRNFPPLGALEFRFTARAYGLGVNSARGVVPRLGLEVQALFLQTPVVPWTASGATGGDGELEFRALLALRLHRPRRPRVLADPVARFATHVIGPTMWADVRQDFPIWNTRTYLDRPRLAGGDGPITAYRRWAAQFYTGSPAAVPGDAVVVG